MHVEIEVLVDQAVACVENWMIITENKRKLGGEPVKKLNKIVYNFIDAIFCSARVNVVAVMLLLLLLFLCLLHAIDLRFPTE